MSQWNNEYKNINHSHNKTSNIKYYFLINLLYIRLINISIKKVDHEMMLPATLTLHRNMDSINKVLINYLERISMWLFRQFSGCYLNEGTFT